LTIQAVNTSVSARGVSMRTQTWFHLIVLISILVPILIAGVTASAQLPDSQTVRIVSFHPDTRTLRPGDTARSDLVLRNYGRTTRQVWIGYSILDPDGRWFDIPAHSVTLGPGETSPPQTKEWRVPQDPPPAAGTYRVVMAVWTALPGAEGAQRLATADRRDSFRVQWDGGPLIDEPGGVWRASEHRLGRGRMRPEQVVASGEGFRLRLLATRCDGAEVHSIERYSFGEYSARLKTPDAPGSLSAFFLYADVSGGNDEIDIEINNDGTRQATLTAWVAGRKTRKTVVHLRFDPAAAHHDYTIRWLAKELVVLADGVRISRWSGGYPRRPMRVIASVWWPAWLPCDPPATDRELSAEWIRLAPLSPSVRR